MANKLTKKQKGFVNDYVKTGNGTQAALNNYDTDDETVASSIASENLSKPLIVKALAERLPDDLLEEKHLALLNKVERKYTSTGELLSEDIDAQAVSKGLDMAYKIKGSYAPEKQINTNVNITITPEAAKLAKEYEEKLKQGL